MIVNDATKADEYMYIMEIIMLEGGSLQSKWYGRLKVATMQRAQLAADIQNVYTVHVQALASTSCNHGHRH